MFILYVCSVPIFSKFIKLKNKELLKNINPHTKSEEKSVNIKNRNTIYDLTENLGDCCNI